VTRFVARIDEFLVLGEKNLSSGLGKKNHKAVLEPSAHHMTPLVAHINVSFV